jgi:protein-S-isoprenylcysteine O-methyltransferase Ste14
VQLPELVQLRYQLQLLRWPGSGTRRLLSLLGSAVFLVLAPGSVAVLVPRWISRWRMQPPFLGLAAVRILGALLIVAGTPVLLESFARFALQGLGTPAPVMPPRHLVVTGLYRHVRNPMYMAVVSIILGQALLLGDPRLLEYAATVWLLFHLFVLVYEEPTLRQTFGAEYDTYRAHVPRWLPRLRPWKQD